MILKIPSVYADPFQYNPILDDPPITPKHTQRVQWTEGSSGFRVGSYTGVYFGSASSYLSSEISSLDAGTHPQFGLYMGYRLQGDQRRRGGLTHRSWSQRFELGFNLALGFGQTYENQMYDDALDLLIRPQITWHALESESWVLSLLLGAQLGSYDLEYGEISQLGVGPFVGPRVTWKMSPTSQFYIDGGWTYIYDFLSYTFRPPSEEELEENPDVIKFKVSGQWFHLYQITLGYRLLGF